ncbi:MAG: glutamine-hydrolyzing carbamoyl-phosphate synthase small subunit [Firmicutes bacterium]|nr:glutamine-hydrolyzing carbamoyl-phosphate synthase small subunit [Bacillota bacterium]
MGEAQKSMTGQPVYLMLANGRVFEGKSFGAPTDGLVGEVVFTTGMVGYLETLTDPSYAGQIVVQTFPLIGNYGMIPEDYESKGIYLSAYIVKEWCKAPSNYRCQGDLDSMLREKGIPGIYGIDTRELARTIREAGTMNGLISTHKPPYLEEELAPMRSYRVDHPVDRVSPQETVIYPAEGERRYKVVLWDYGAKANIHRELQKRGCEVIDVPAASTAEEILALQPDGVMLSNGPGDPEDNEGVIREIRKITDARMPVFGICLGHQLLALAKGAKTGKMKFGHRGGNQPVKNLETGRVYITSQNHGYEVLADTLPAGAEQSFINVNDGTCEGVRYTDTPAYTVQFHPEACGGPKDTEWLFGKFLELMDENRKGDAVCR